MPLFVWSTHFMWVDVSAGLPNSWPSWIWIRQLSDPLLSIWPFLQAKKLFVFFTFFSVCTKFTFQKRKTSEKYSFECFRFPRKFLFEPSWYSYYAIFSGHIGGGYREIQEIGAHRRDLQTLAGPTGSVKNTCCRSWNYLSFYVFIDPVAPAKVSNQAVQRDPTGGSRTLVSASRAKTTK